MKTIEREVIIVGAGPGGSMCAGYLAREGVDVLLLEKETFPREKPCGEGLGGDAMIHIKELGAYDELMKYAEMCKGFQFYAPDHSVCYVPTVPDTEYHCPRRIGDNIYRQNAERLGAEVWEDCWVYDVIMEDGQVKGVKAKYQGEYIELRSKIVIGADGAHSKIAKAAGLFFDDDEDAIAVVARGYMRNVKGLDGWNEFFFDEAVTPGYVWLMPYEKYEKGFVNFGIGYMRKAYEGRKLMDVANEWLKLPQYKDRFVDMEWAAPMKGWRIPQNHLQGKNVANGLMLIGDAAAMNVPVSGEGVGPAMCAGAWASLTAMDALKRNDFTVEGGLASYPEYVNKYMVPEFKEMRKLLDNIYDPAKCNAYIKTLRDDPVANAKANEGFQGKLMFAEFPFKNVKVE